jgi:hypothetical protein
MKTKNYFLLTIGLFISNLSFSQVSEYGVALGPKMNLPIEFLPEINLPLIDNDSLREFSDSADFGKEYVGVVIDEMHYFWEESKKDTIILDSFSIYEISRLKIVSPNAVSLGIIFSQFHLVGDMKLYIYGTEEGYPQEIVGAYTKENNRSDQTLVTREIFGNEIIIEVNRKIVAGIGDLGSLNIKSFLHFYKNTNDFGEALPCHVNAICSPWYNTYCNEVRSVVKIQTIEEDGGVAVASGALINNTDNNFDPLIITAKHVLEGATRFNEWTFFFNFQSNTCNPSNNGNDLMVVQGMTEIASDRIWTGIGCPDISLLRLMESVPLQYNAFFSAWNRRAYSSLSDDDRAIGIHHPSGDVKKISEGYRKNPPLSTCIKTNWTTGYTERGSSGSPLYVTSKEIVGVLAWGV